jgi:hypothetical protein
MNLTIGLRCVLALVERQSLRLMITARTSYRVWHNLTFATGGGDGV